MHDVKEQCLAAMKRIKAGNANRRGAIPASMAPRVVEQAGPLMAYPPMKIEEGKRVGTNVIRFRR